MSDLTRDFHNWQQAAGFAPEIHQEGDHIVLEVEVFWKTMRREYDHEGRRIEP